MHLSLVSNKRHFLLWKANQLAFQFDTVADLLVEIIFLQKSHTNVFWDDYMNTLEVMKNVLHLTPESSRNYFTCIRSTGNKRQKFRTQKIVTRFSWEKNLKLL